VSYRYGIPTNNRIVDGSPRTYLHRRRPVLDWFGESGGYGVFLEFVGTIFIAAGIGEIWAVEAAVLRRVKRREP